MLKGLSNRKILKHIMREKKAILKGKKVKTRILRPAEYLLLRSAAATEINNLTNLDACLLLGARYLECKKIQLNQDWFDGDFIHMPWTEELSKSRHNPDRWIRLSSMGKVIMPYFLENKKTLPSVQAWDKNLKKWAKKAGFEGEGVSARSLRKTYESWLIFYYPDASNLIFLSQGHATLTSLHHYINLPFTVEDKREMEKWVEGYV